MSHVSGRETLLLTQSSSIESLVTASTATFGAVTSMRLDHATDALWRSSASWAVVIDLAPAGLEEALVVARAIRKRKARSLILGVATLANDLESIHRVTTAAGFSDVVLVEVGEVESLMGAHLRDDSRGGAYAAALRCARRSVPPQQQALARAAIEEVSSCSSVECFGERVGSSRWKLDRTLGAAGISASDFLDCCRIVLATAFLEHSGWTVKRAANAVGYGDIRAFREATTILVGCLPSDLKATGSTERTGRAVASHLVACAAHPRVQKPRDLPWLRAAEKLL